MLDRYKRIFFLFLFLVYLFIPHSCIAQRRNHSERRHLSFTEELQTITQEITQKSKKRSYDLILEFGLGNFAYDLVTGYAEQSAYIGDMSSIKTLLRIKETGGTWVIEVSGEVFGTGNKLERWWSGQKLFRINKLMVRGLCMEALIQYNFDEIALYPFPVLANSNVGLGFIYRFHGLRRKDISKLMEIENDSPIPAETDYALFGIEPVLGFNFKLDSGRMTGFMDMGIGLYGASIEDNYDSNGFSTSPEKTTGRSVLARVGLMGSLKRIHYQIGYSIDRFKIKAKESIPESRTKLSRIAFNLGINF